MREAQEKRMVRVLDTITAPTIESLPGHQRSHVEQLQNVLAQPNVVAIGIAEKISNGKNLGRLSIAFYVAKKLPLRKIAGNHVIPPAVPESVSGTTTVPTDVVELGRIELQGHGAGPFIQKKPIQPGNSVGHVKCTAGTLGAIVTRKGKQLILSNSHVLALSGKAKKGDPILYPGKADKGKVPGDVIARLENDIKFVTGGQQVNEVDCAIAAIEPTNVRPVDPCIRGARGPKGVMSAKRGMKVQISGRSSGISDGEIKDVHLKFTINYPGVGSVGFTDQVLCTRYSQSGDSGSLVIEKKSSKAVGLHFAGASGGSVFCPIDKVLKKLNVSLELARRAVQPRLPQRRPRPS